MDLRTGAGAGSAVPIGSWEAIAGTSRRTVAALEYLVGRADQHGTVTVTHRGMATDLAWPLDGRGRSQAVQRAVKTLVDGGAIRVLGRRREGGDYVIEVVVDFARAGVKERLANVNGESEAILNCTDSKPARRPADTRRYTERAHGGRPAELRALLTLARPTRLRAAAPA